MAYKTKENLKKVLTVIVILTMLPFSTVTSGLMGDTGHTHAHAHEEGGLPGCGDACDDDHSITLASGAQVNIDMEPELAQAFGIMSIPTLVVVKGGREVNRAVGVQPKAAILGMIQ